MKTVNVNPLDDIRFNNDIEEGITLGYTVACAQRPINGLKTWEGESLGNGIYFAYGPLDQFKSNWKFLDASVVSIQTNTDIINIINSFCLEEEMTLKDLLEDNTIEEIAASLNLNYC